MLFQSFVKGSPRGDAFGGASYRVTNSVGVRPLERLTSPQ